VAQSKYVDLAPTDKADETGEYSRALMFATSNPRVSNIALTGPYGSGKSSVIKAFLGVYKRPALQISLAAFLPEAAATGGEVSKQEIERSILQQMLYGADANKLPLSRFKRIQLPRKWSFLVPVYIIIGIFSCWYVLQQREKILKGDYFSSENTIDWLGTICLFLGFVFLWSVVHKIYVTSFGLSLKSISLKDIEITPVGFSQESILNRHLDEIIYFFQSTKYDLVIIEDLDRFNNPEIFVTLREINSIINANSGVRRTIRFLYALRDNMFVNTDRTKFFEFILPVIPIINSSNSIDKFLERGNLLSISNRLDRRFVSDVSRYLSDLRLIQNIFNEYVTYIANLEADGESILDANKLLAVLVYKNIFPSDFERLHQGKGNLAQILGRYDEYVINAEAEYKAKISRLEQELDIAERQIPSDLAELRKIYAMTLISKIPVTHTTIDMPGGESCPTNSIAEHQQFDQLIDEPEIICRTNHGTGRRFDISDVQMDVNPVKSFLDRKNEIVRKNNDVKDRFFKEIKDLRLKLARVRLRKFNEVIRDSAISTEELFVDFGENKNLARFLVFDGYIDDTYYQYTSLFHSGRLSPSDNKFLIQIRGFTTPAPNFQIDNPSEVIDEMRIEDFRQNYVLNTNLVDCLLSNSAAYNIHSSSLFLFIDGNFDECEEFFLSYYDVGKNVSTLMRELFDRHPTFVNEVLKSNNNFIHVGQIITHLSDVQLKKLHTHSPQFSEFVSVNLSKILALGADFVPARLKNISLELVELESISEYPLIARVLVEEGLYKLSIENIEFVFAAVVGSRDVTQLRTKNYSTILRAGYGPLIAKVEKRFSEYLRDVLLRIESNSEEEISTILKVINQSDIDVNVLREFLAGQAEILTSLDEVPDHLHSLLFELQKISPSWDNCVSYLESSNFDDGILTNYLCEKQALAVLSKIAIPSDNRMFGVRDFLFGNHELHDEAYRAYIKCLPNKFEKFPAEFSVEKLRILIEERKVSFRKENFLRLEDNEDLQLLFVVKNIQDYVENLSQFAVDDEFHEKILKQDIGDGHKVGIIQVMDISSLGNFPTRAALIGPVLARAHTIIGDRVNAEAAEAMVINSKPISVQIALFNKFQNKLDDDQVRHIVQKLPDPFPEIKVGWNRPAIKNTEENIGFVKCLKERGFISSWREGRDDIRIHLFRS
jgi:hypothetical protein